MTDMVLARRFPAPLHDRDLQRMTDTVAACLALHGVEWRQSLLSVDGTRMLCHFHAPDAECVRLALRQAEGEVLALCPASVHDAPAPPPAPANVVVERRFKDAVRLADIQAIETAHAWCLEARRVRFLRTYFAWSRQQMWCLYRAPDAESVRVAQRQAGMPLQRVWGCRAIAAPSGPAPPY